MVTKNEALIITAAVALAFVPRFEAKVQQYAQSHRTEIQMAVNELQGKPAIPFAAPASAPDAVPVPDEGTMQLASLQEELPQVDLVREQARAMEHFQIAQRKQFHAQALAMRPAMRTFTRVKMAELAPQLAKLKVLVNENNRMVQVYRLNAKKCPRVPLVPGTPAVPEPASYTVEVSPLP